MKVYGIIALLSAVSVMAAPAPLANVEEASIGNHLVARSVQTIQLYTKTDFQGFQTSLAVTIGSCKKLPPNAKDGTKSASGFGEYKCTFFRQSDCEGADDQNDTKSCDPNVCGTSKVNLSFIKSFAPLVAGHARSVRCTPF